MAGKPILVCSKNKDFMGFIKELVGDLEYSLSAISETKEIQELKPETAPSVLIIDYHEKQAIALEEIVLAAWMVIPDLKIAMIYHGVFQGELHDKLQNNENIVWLQNPFEMEVLLDWLLKVAPVEIAPSALKIEHLSSVRIADIGAKEKFNFDIYHYMPANKKFILYRRKNSALTEEQVKKFSSSNVRDFYVRKSEFPEVQQYLSNRLKSVLKDGALSDVERREKLQHEAKEIFRTLLGAKPNGAKESRAVLEACKGVALIFIKETSQKPELYQKLLEISSTGHSNYNHSINVSIYCTLFAMALGEKNLEAASIGGLLHDIGLSTFEHKLDERQMDRLEPMDQLLLRSHPEEAFKLLSEKRSISDKDIFQMILGHHEHMDGSGYPRGVKGEQISRLARICAIADEFDHLTSVRLNQRTLSPLEAIEKMNTDNQTPGRPVRFDQKMLNEISSMFVPPSQFIVDDHKVREMMRSPEPAASDEDKPLTREETEAIKRARKA